VRATRFLADRVQLPVVHEALDLEVAGVRARRAHPHPLGPAWTLGYGPRPLHRPTSLEPVVAEAELTQDDGGTVPAGDGWFVVNVRDAQWYESEGLGFFVPFEG